MKFNSITSLLSTAVMFIGLAQDSLAEDPANVDSSAESVTTVPTDTLEPFIKAYCIRCHGPEKQNGDVRFDQVNWEITNTDIAQRWQDVLDVLCTVEGSVWSRSCTSCVYICLPSARMPVVCLLR